MKNWLLLLKRKTLALVKLPVAQQLLMLNHQWVSIFQNLREQVVAVEQKNIHLMQVCKFINIYKIHCFVFNFHIIMYKNNSQLP